MAQTWAAKAPAEIVERRWTVPVDDDDRLASFASSASGVTIDSYKVQSNDAVLTLSAGMAGAMATVVLTATTTQGRVLVETFYLPIVVTTAGTVTARDICDFALRKIAGIGVDADSGEADDALELLQGVMARFGLGPVPMALTSEVGLADEYLLPLKFVLRRLAHSTYEAELTPTDARLADEGERFLLSRKTTPENLKMSEALAVQWQRSAVWNLF